MKRNYILLILLMIGTGAGFGQNITIRGQVINKLSKQPVSEANIVLPDKTSTSTGAYGTFEIKVARFPANLSVSHVGYEKRVLTLAVDPKKLLIIELNESLSTLGEVQVTAKRTTILTEKDDFTLQDFACENEHLWLLGYLKNQAHRGRLWLSNLYGDTLNSIPVKGPERLYTDVFGYVHLVMPDSVYQLHTDGNDIRMAYSCGRSEFFQLMDPVKAEFASRLVYQDFLERRQGLHTYYLSGEDTLPQLLNIARDSTEEARVICDYIYGKELCYYWTARAHLGEESHNARVYIIEHKLTKDLAVNHSVKAPVFALSDTLYLINLYKDSLNVYDPSGKYNRSISIKFHRDSLLFDVNYKDLNYLTDPIYNKAYVLKKGTGTVDLTAFDPSSGRLGSRVPIPDYPGMSEIKIYGQAVYFLYPEKKYPYYVRLHRYNL